MQVINHTKGVVLADSAEVADTWCSRLRGLMGRKLLPGGCCLVIHPCNSMHTCFMRFNIDVLFVSREGRVVRLLENMPPFRFSPIVRGGRYVIELPAGLISSSGTCIDDTVFFGNYAGNALFVVETIKRG